MRHHGGLVIICFRPLQLQNQSFTIIQAFTGHMMNGSKLSAPGKQRLQLNDLPGTDEVDENDS